MARKNKLEKAAESMFINDGATAKEIAETLGVREATVGSWRKNGEWDKQREEHLAAPHIIRKILIKELKNVAEGNKSGIDTNALSQISKVIEAQSYRLSPQVVISVIKELDNFMINENPQLAAELTPYHRKFIIHKINNQNG